jgi:hypothetical protein
MAYLNVLLWYLCERTRINHRTTGFAFCGTFERLFLKVFELFSMATFGENCMRVRDRMLSLY